MFETKTKIYDYECYKDGDLYFYQPFDKPGLRRSSSSLYDILNSLIEVSGKDEKFGYLIFKEKLLKEEEFEYFLKGIKIVYYQEKLDMKNKIDLVEKDLLRLRDQLNKKGLLLTELKNFYQRIKDL